MKILEIDSTSEVFDEAFSMSFIKPDRNYINNDIVGSVYFFLNDDAVSLIGSHRLIQLKSFFDNRYSDYIIIGLIIDDDQAMKFMLAYGKVPCEEYNSNIHVPKHKSDVS